MPKLVLFDESSKKKTHTIILDMEPYNGDVSIDVVPKTRSLVMQAIEKSKRNRLHNRHKEFNEELQKEVSVNGRPDDAFVQEIADLLVQGWDGIVDSTGNPVECTREAKIALFENVEVANFLLKASGELGSEKDSEDVENLGK